MKQGKRGRPKKKRASWAIKPLIDFLNYTPGAPAEPVLSAILSTLKLGEMAPLQDQLIADLLPFTLPITKEKGDEYLLKLCSKLDSFEFTMKFSALRADKDLFVGEPNLVRRELSSQQKLFKWGKGSWVIGPHHPIKLKEDPAEKSFYYLVAAGLRNGELAMLRRCQQCPGFFIADEARQIFCSPQHARDYWDQPKLAKARVYKSREQRS